MFEFHLVLMFGFLAYGLAFYAMALAIVLEWRSDSELPLTQALPALAVFAFLQGLAEWMNMSALIRTDGLSPTSSSSAMEMIKAVILGGSYLFLLWFGIDLLVRLEPRRLGARWLAFALFLGWCTTTFATIQWGHLSSSEWPRLADGLARYFLVLPGGFLAVWGLHKQKKVFDRLGMSQTGMDCIWAGLLFASCSLSLVVIAPRPFPLLDGRIAGHDHLAAGNSWAQLLHALLAMGIAFFILRVLRAYKEELHRRVEAADRARNLAQLETLEAHQKAEEQLRRWNETLERQVLHRTNELERRQKEADALYQIGTEILALMNLDAILRSVAEKSCQLLRADLSTLALAEGELEIIRLRAVHGNRTEAFSQLRLEPGKGVAGKVLATGMPLAIRDYLTCTEIERTAEVDDVVAAEGLRAHLAIPIKMSDQVLGVLCVASRGARCFDETDHWLLARLALITAIALQNSHLYNQSQQVAVLEERERIGREIHDGLAQALGALGMMVRVAQSRLDNGQVARVQKDLREMEQVAQDAFSDAREAILGLRVSAYGGTELLRSLREYIRRFGEQCGLETRLVVDDGWPVLLPPDAETQIMRIVQEALSNVRKHAEARKVSVEFKVLHEYAEIEVGDDGRGFDADRCMDCERPGQEEACPGCSGCHFGLQAMRERATAIGAELAVLSAQGVGTRVIIRLPHSALHGDRQPAMQTVA